MSRTNIVIDNELLAQAMRMTGAKTKRQAVEVALKRLVNQETVFEALRSMRGEAPWRGEIENWRHDRA